MSAEQGSVAPTRRRYTKAQKEQAVRLVRQIREETGERHGAVQRVARQPAMASRRCVSGRTRPASTPVNGPG